MYRETGWSREVSTLNLRYGGEEIKSSAGALIFVLSQNDITIYTVSLSSPRCLNGYQKIVGGNLKKKKSF